MSSSQPTWRDRIKAVASSPAPAIPPSPLVQTLEDFRVTLNETPWIRAELHTMGHFQRRTLFVYPKYRRDVSAMLLTFWLESDSVRVMGMNGATFHHPEELGAFLADFVEMSAFPTTVDEYRRLQGEDVHGMLRVRGISQNDPADVPVLVGATEHNEMAKRVLDGRLDTPYGLRVAIEEHPTKARFDPEREYACLDSAGFGLRIVGGARADASFSSGKVLQLHGDLLPLDDLRA